MRITGGGKLFRDLTNPMQNLLWLVKIYHPHLAQLRDNTNFTISDLQNNAKTPNLTNNWHLSKFWVLYSILDVSKGETKRINLRGSKILILSRQSRFWCPSDLSFLFYIWRHVKLNVKLKNLSGVNFFVKLGVLVLFCKSLIKKFVPTLNCAKYGC